MHLEILVTLLRPQLSKALKHINSPIKLNGQLTCLKLDICLSTLLNQGLNYSSLTISKESEGLGLSTPMVLQYKICTLTPLNTEAKTFKEDTNKLA